MIMQREESISEEYSEDQNKNGLPLQTSTDLNINFKNVHYQFQ